LDQWSLAAGRCANCNTVVRKLSQRTIDDRRLVRKRGGEPGNAADELTSQSLPSIDITDTDRPGATIELTPSDRARDAAPPDDTPLQSRKPLDTERKMATIGDRSDLTVEFQPPSVPDADQQDSGEVDERATRTIEKDQTVDFDLTPSELEQLDSQWRGTFEVGSKQSQTIRQKETVSGFRSSLPVKSRYIRERRKSDGPPPTTPAEVPDYELLDIIGEGGMGVVYAAHQSSIARTVAVKMLKPSAKTRADQRDKFISEAVVTGELDHPNIVPIYDLGSNDEGALFYSMKRVRGTPWDKVLHQKQLDENLSILLRVADAVAFAHAGGVIHRDLKPENVMLGDYGEVLVMDWGLARITPEFAHVDTVFQPDSLGGTPAYMSPEMARGPVESINKTSDIYLLGAILYEIIGGQPPHSGRDVMQCLMAASQNRIDPVRYEGELKEIALKAMATRQEDRYQSVKEFQEAIRVYQSHSESLVLTAHANQNLQKARASEDYQLYARALYGCQEALALWEENHRARTLLADTQQDYAQCALDNGDLDLAASLLDTSNAEHQELLTRIEAARAERNARQRRLRYAKIAVAALIAGIITTSTVATFVVRHQRNKAIAAELQARAAEQAEAVARRQAEQDRDAARRAKEEEEIARKDAELAKENESVARTAAEDAKIREEYEAYIAEIGLAAAKINDNAYDFARQLLEQSKPELRNWEWGRLMHLAGLGTAAYDAGAPVQAVAYSPDGLSFASGDMAGKVTVRNAQTGEIRFQVPHGQYVLSIAYSADGGRIASGSSDNTIQIVSATNGQVLRTLPGHTDGVLSVRFSPDSEQLLSGSYDNTARLWDIASGQVLQEFKGHTWWVWAAEFSPDATRIVTASQDGKAIVWQKRGAGSGEQGAGSTTQETASNRISLTPRYVQLTEFTGHDGAVYSARFSPNGKLIATGGYDGFVMVWNPDEVRPIDIERRLAGEPDPKANYVRLAGHEKPVRSVDFSPNGKLALSGGEDNTIRVWDAASGESRKILRGHGSAVRSCVFSFDGQRVLSGGEDQSLRVWDLEGYQEARVLHAKVFTGHVDAVLSARFSRDGRQIVTASRDRTASLWDAETGQPLRRFEEGHEFLVSAVAFFPEPTADAESTGTRAGAGNTLPRRRLATGAGDNSVRIWDATAGTELTTLTPTGRIGSLAVSPDGKWLATGSPGTDVKLWNAETGGLVATLGGHDAEVSGLAFSPAGDRLASGDDRGRVRIWFDQGRQRGLQQWIFERELDGHNGSITALRFTPDGSRLVVASGDRTCGQWDLATGQELRELVLKHPEWVSSLDISADGLRALTTCDDGQARLWRLADAALLASVRSPGTPFNAVAFSPDASTSVLTAAADKQVMLWDLSIAALPLSNQSPQSSAALGRLSQSAIRNPQSEIARNSIDEAALRPLLDFNKSGGEVWSAMFAPDGRHVLTIGGNDAQLWDVASQTLVVRYSPHGTVASAAISPDGALVATGSWDHSAKIWDAATGRAIRKLQGGHRGHINAVEFSLDGRQLLTAGDDGIARLWNVETGKPTGTHFLGHSARITAATFSQDGTQVLTASGDTTARIWDPATGREIHRLTGHQWAVLCGQFSHDGQRAITGSADNTAKIWDLTTGKESITLAGHTAAVTSVAFSPDATRVLTGSRDNTAKLWDAQTGKEIVSLPGHTQEVTSVAFSPDGLRVLTASRDGTAIIWLAKDWRERPIADLGLRIEGMRR
jgi:WD40 repeat protein/serine/threonine protein kinase